MDRAQQDLFPSPQGDLFGGEAPIPVRPAYQVNPQHVLNRLVDMLADMRAAEQWPWSPVRVDLNRHTVWPYLLRLLPQSDAQQWKADLDAEAERLDAALGARAA